jgi:hypothetical protein
VLNRGSDRLEVEVDRGLREGAKGRPFDELRPQVVEAGLSKDACRYHFDLV